MAGGACLYFFLFLARDLGSCCGCEAWGSPVRERQPRQRSDRGRLVGSHRAVAYLSAPSLLFLPASFFFPTGSSGAGQSRDLPSRHVCLYSAPLSLPAVLTP
jgi:hypothetical protein